MQTTWRYVLTLTKGATEYDLYSITLFPKRYVSSRFCDCTLLCLKCPVDERVFFPQGERGACSRSGLQPKKVSSETHPTESEEENVQI